MLYVWWNGQADSDWDSYEERQFQTNGAREGQEVWQKLIEAEMKTNWKRQTGIDRKGKERKTKTNWVKQYRQASKLNKDTLIETSKH